METTASVEEIADTLTKIGLEVEEVFNPAANLKGFVTAKVENCEMHPDSDHLHLLAVNDGKQALQVVCGAPNVKKIWWEFCSGRDAYPLVITKF